MFKTSSHSRAIQHLSIINKQDEYGTPYDVYSDAVKKYEIYPQIDVAASKTNHVLDHYYTIDQDFLRQNVNRPFFMNAPYSRIAEFMEHAYNQHKKWNNDIIILSYAKTDTKWWHNFVEGKAEVHFIEGRIRFNDDEGKLTKHSAPYPSVWIIYRRK